MLHFMIPRRIACTLFLFFAIVGFLILSVSSSIRKSNHREIQSLSKKTVYPFNRAQGVQVAINIVIIKLILRHFKWTYIRIIYQDIVLIYFAMLDTRRERLRFPLKTIFLFIFLQILYCLLVSRLVGN